MGNVAIIPVRQNSTRVPLKGFKEFDDTTLLDLKIEVLSKISSIDKIVVSTDSPKAKEIARRRGVLVHEREPYFASSDCSGSEFFENLAKSFDDDIILYCPPTSPFLKAETVRKAIAIFEKELGYDSVVTVAPVKHHMWLNGSPLNYDIQNSPNSQDLPNIVRLTYGICVLKRETVLQYRNVIGKKPFFIEVGEIEAIDIDTEQDFRYAEFIKKGNYV